jgi:hypothetical protein
MKHKPQICLQHSVVLLTNYYWGDDSLSSNNESDDIDMDAGLD